MYHLFGLNVYLWLTEKAARVGWQNGFVQLPAQACTEDGEIRATSEATAQGMSRERAGVPRPEGKISFIVVILL